MKLLGIKIFKYVKYSNKFQCLILNLIIQNIQHIPVSKHMEALKYEGTLNSTYNEKKYAEILLHYRQLFVKNDVFIGERGIFGAEVFLHYRPFFIKSNFIIGRVECIRLRYYIKHIH